MIFLFLKGPQGNFYIESYLDEHPEFLDSYVLRKEKPATVERWHQLQQPLAVPGELTVSLDTVNVSSQSEAVILTVDQSEHSTRQPRVRQRWPQSPGQLPPNWGILRRAGKRDGVQVYTLIRLSGEDLSLCRLHAHAPEVIHHHAQKAEVSSSDTTQVREGTLWTFVH